MHWVDEIDYVFAFAYVFGTVLAGSTIFYNHVMYRLFENPLVASVMALVAIISVNAWAIISIGRKIDEIKENDEG